MVYILGHRGDFENYESNSKEGVISSFEKCDGVELDLNISADNILFFCHEKDLTNKIIARNFSYKDISKFFKKNSILSLKEGIQLVNKYNKILCIHSEIGGGGLKWSKPFSINEMKQVIDICKTCIYSDKIIFHTISNKTFDFYSKEGFRVFYRGKNLKQNSMLRINELKNNNYIDFSQTMAYTINNSEEIKFLLNKNIGFILTDKLSLFKL